MEVGTIWLSAFFGRLLLAISVKRSELTEGHHQEWSPRLDLTLLGKSLPEPSLAARGRRLSFSRLGFLGRGSPRWFRWCVTVLVSSTTLTTTFQTIANAGESASRARSLLSVACPCRLASRVVGGRRGLLLALGGSSPPASLLSERAWLSIPHLGGGFETIAIWLILPVVICLSQRLSHACLSSHCLTVKPRMAH